MEWERVCCQGQIAVRIAFHLLCAGIVLSHNLLGFSLGPGFHMQFDMLHNMSLPLLLAPSFSDWKADNCALLTRPWLFFLAHIFLVCIFFSPILLMFLYIRMPVTDFSRFCTLPIFSPLCLRCGKKKKNRLAWKPLKME